MPTPRERGINLVIGNWRDIGMLKATPQPIVDAILDLTRKVAHDATFRDVLGRSNLGWTFAEAAELEAAIALERAVFQDITQGLQLT